MAKLPSFQFYPGDWVKDPDLRRCSYFAKGLLVDLLCLMHENSVRGKLCEPDGVTPWSDDHILKALGATGDDVTQHLIELQELNVLSRDDNGCLFSRRMVREEELRQIRARAGRSGGLAKSKQTSSKRPSKTQAKLKQIPEDEDEDEESSSSEEIREQTVIPGNGELAKISDEQHQAFWVFWEIWPRDTDRNGSERAWLEVNPDAELIEQILSRAREWKAKADAEGTARYIPSAKTWLLRAGWCETVEVENAGF